MIKNSMKKVIAAVMICLLTFAMTGCSAKEMTVTVNDMGATSELTVKVGTTVKDAIAAANITLGDMDEAEPALDVELTAETTEITIKRWTSVTLVKGDESMTVELVGGKVEDAIKASGLEISDDDHVDIPLDSYLTDGMTITFTSGTPSAEPQSTDSGEDSAEANGEKTVVSKTPTYNCSGDGHGYYTITYSDGSVEYEEF